ncbi:dynein heavy chain 7 [Volvox carteri f. nagariensis]|uniref:Dynein heavy chain 7 n=1 Tax=Volvox carteri f. nagariensis TaxID=3068 RepID=D8TGX0_VOLCA|nr:dynein heavy chain 7 [Volvox carteri f. nagariensis]EFJ52606.1 dynein heavy chain 7 [Volvox carteri f. nagariensis]|eukprot:XP_002945611.1 dynein heavy chain 7 [Volvox carteri f. nagariensis]
MCCPYPAPKVVPFAAIDQRDFYTMSVRGITHYLDGTSSDFATLEQWERELHLFSRLKHLKIFRLYKLWRAFRLWKRAVNQHKFHKARAALERNLFQLSPVFQGPLRRFHGLCFELSHMRMHNVEPVKVYTLDEFVGAQSDHKAAVEVRLGQFHEDTFQTVLQACSLALLPSSFLHDENESQRAGELAKSQHSNFLARAEAEKDREQGQSDFAYTIAAARRSEQRRLLNFIRLADYMVCDTLHSVLLESLRELLDSTRPKRPVMVLFQDMDAAAADAAEAAVAAADAERKTAPAATDALFQLELLLAENQEDLLYDPHPEEFFEEMQRIMANYLESLCGITRLYGDGTLMSVVMGDKAGEVEPGTELQELITNENYDDMVVSVRDSVVEAFQHAEDHKQCYLPYRDMAVDGEASSSPSPQQQRVTLATFRQLMDLLAEQKAQMEALLPHRDVSIVRIAVGHFKDAVIPSPTRCLEEMHAMLPALAADLFHDFMSTVQNALSRLQAPSSAVEEYVEKLQFLGEVRESEKRLDFACNEIHDLYGLIDEYNIPVSPMDRAAYATMDSTYNTLKTTMEEVEGARDDHVSKYSANLEQGIEAISKEVTEIRNEAQHEMVLSEESEHDKVVAYLNQLKEAVDRLMAESARINKYQRLFKVPEAKSEDLTDTADEVNLKLNLWLGRSEWESITDIWCATHFESLDMQVLEETTNKFHKMVYKMERGLPPNKLVPKFRAAVDDFRNLLPVVSALRNRALKERHWNKIFETIGQQIVRDNSFTLQVLLDAKVQVWKDSISTISTEATQEMALEELLAKIALEDSMVTMSTILASRFVTGIRPEVEKVERQLTLFADTLDEWISVQKAWMYLEPIFSAIDIQRQLPVEAKAFFAVDKQLREIMRRTKDRPNALMAGTHPGVLETFQKANETLEKIQKNLEDYLETKRMAFPRFYFLSNDELLEILAQTKNVQAVQPHMGKCFDGIRRLDFGDDPKSIDIHAMISGEGERVSLGKNTKARGNVEKWLGDVESAMIANLKKLAKAGWVAYPEEARSAWVLKQPAQLVIAISQVFWCHGVEEALRSVDPVGAMGDYRAVNVRQLADLTKLVRGELSSLHRRIIAALITIDVHARDIVDALHSGRVTDINSFQWQMQLRYYFENEDIIVRQVNARFVYAYEYLGAQPRLVVTPMTDRCYLTLTGALHLKLGGAPAGPAGTGKTETTKDLGKALGVNCVVFNCGDNLDYKFMGKFFSGLAQCGAWACFDEFNRIDIEVLSVVAQQLLTIQNALKASMSTFNFEGRVIKLVPTCGVFITMNPGYAGRTELPDNLKALFRPMAMMIPDYALVAEVMLFSEGFEDSKTLSRKMVKLYKLSSEQLSQQDHYDFGMRAVKSVLVMAGSLKRANPDLSEDVVLIRAMRDSNLPKFLVDDVELFQNIISDLFPGLTVPDQDFGELEQSIRAVLSSRGLQQPQSFVTKVIQLYDTMNVRFGVMLVGPTGGGKTECYRTLQGATTRLRTELKHPSDKYQVTHTYTFNPKCIKMGELYGEYNLLTNEWSDGLGSTLIRSAVNDTTPDRKWVVFDGPVDAIWIENMNTVLDDNCTLCLPNGERIKLNPVTMRMLFEVQDLAVASPATVSRCGMVYIALEELGWRPAVQTWARQKLPAAIPQAIYTMFDQYVDAGLAFVRKQGKEYIATPARECLPIQRLLLSACVQSLVSPSRGFQWGAKPEEITMALSKLFGFCYVWALGGNLMHTVKEEFDEFVREHLQMVCAFPGSATVFDFYLDCNKRFPPEFKNWTDIVPSFTYKRELPYFQMMVPTVDTVRFSYLLDACLDVQRSVLFTGVTGVGKSVITVAALEDIRERKNVVPFTINFSAQTQAIDTQLLIESKLEKKRKTRYGAPVNKRIVFFVDDVNMPAREKYGAQPPIELLRQFQDFKGFYDRKKLFWKDVEDTTLCAACAPPGGGRQEITPRFVRHFTMLCVPPPSDAATKTILSAIFNGFLSDFPRDMASVAVPIVFQGLLMITPGNCKDRDTMMRLWLHESCRVFHDRLINNEDKEYFKRMLVELATKHGLGSAGYDELFGPGRYIMFGDWIKIGLDRDERRYEEIGTDVSRVVAVLEEYLDEYNLSNTNSLNLVFFMDAVEHITRIARILRQPRGNAMLVGVGGSGKSSLTRFATFMGGFKSFSIELTRGYGANEFREDLKKLYRTAGIDGEPVVFLFSDTQIVQEGFLEDINNMLNSGEVPGMFAQDEKDRIVNDIREWVLATGGNPSKDGCYTAFINRVRDNLHLVLAMSPVGEAFRSRCRQFPSLINCTTIDWFSAWPEEALLSVSKKFLANTDLGGDAVRDALAAMCVTIHTSVSTASDRFYAELRRRYYTTPKSYLDLINLYLQLLSDKRDELSTAKDRLLNGLGKLSDTNSLVDRMKAELAGLQPILEAKSRATADLLVKVAADQEQAEKVKKVVAAEERDVKAMQVETQAMADSAKADLDEAMPALNAALAALKALDKNDIVEIKSFPKPPQAVQMTMEAVCILKGEKPDWDTAKRLLGDGGFMRSLEEFDKDNISDATIKKLQKYLENPDYTPDLVAKVSKAARSLCMWTHAMNTYNRVAKVVGPKKIALRQAESQLAEANAKLADKQAALREVEERVENLRRQLADAQREQRELNDQADLTRKRLERAGKLTSGLADEGVRWQATAETIGEQLIKLVGDVFLSAACIAYYGAFTGAYRQMLVSSWIAECKSRGIPVSEAASLRSTLGNPVEIREWNIWGLPTDDVSVDNGILVTRGKRWPLMIDPQGQANGWIKAMESRNGLRCIKLTDGNFLRTLENSIRIGNPVLIEDVGEALDPALEPVLQKAIFKQGGRTLIRLGDSDVDYDPNFRFFITTKLANPHYLPEVCIKVTIINFTVTMKGLEDQLLGEVVRKERPDLEEAKDRLVLSISADKKQLGELEDKILKLLKESSGNILDDEQLINTLNHSKTTSSVISNRVQEAEVTERSINEAREHYRPAATRGSILYFVIADLSLISPMYQFSLSYFAKMFSYCIDKSEKADDVPTRLQLLSDFVTRFIYNNVSRGLFEEHKLLYSFLLCTSVLRHVSAGPEITAAEWNFFVRGAGGAPPPNRPNPHPDWITHAAWTALMHLEHTVPDVFSGLAESFATEGMEWQALFEADEPHLLPLPGDWETRLTSQRPFAKLLVIKVLREEKLIFACAQYVAGKLGTEFTEPPPWSLDDVFPDTSCRTPIIFILSTGADPTAMLQRFAEKNGYVTGERLHMISLGQGQGPIAEMLINQAIKTGDWVCLQNCHLASSWMLRLEEKVEELSKESTQVHPEFRLWLTSMPSKVFPVLVLQNGIKLTNEPPKGVKANINRTYNDLTPEALNACPAKPVPFKKLLFALSFFHAVVQERRKFGPLGWNIRYEFNTSDLECSAMTLRMFLSEQEQIPWPAIEYVVGQINYGGRVTDDLDRRLYYSPNAEGSLEDYRDYIRGLPATEAPEVFGMHTNANISFQLQETRKLVEAVLSIQPRLSSGSAGKSPDETVSELAAELQGGLPPLLSRDEAAAGLFDRTETGQLNSLSVVLGQEMDRFNRLSAAVASSLAELQKAIKGLVVMSGELEGVYNSMLNNQVPEAWSRYAYPSLKPLASWVADYHQRIGFMRSWLAGGTPKCFWLPGFFFPQGFMTGVLQMHARKYSIPIDTLSFGFQVTPHDAPDQVPLEAVPEDGILIDGLWIDGARWDRSAAWLDESEPGVMYAPLPVIHFKPMQDYEPPSSEYQCPLYKTSVRAGVLSTTGQSTNFVLCVSLPMRDGTSSDFWILQGVALLCMLDD